MSSVTARRAKAIALIKAGLIHSQSDLVKQLKKAGFVVTQATASRDLPPYREPCQPHLY